jgi:hypothetical protein
VCRGIPDNDEVVEWCAPAGFVRQGASEEFVLSIRIFGEVSTSCTRGFNGFALAQLGSLLAIFLSAGRRSRPELIVCTALTPVATPHDSGSFAATAVGSVYAGDMQAQANPVWKPVG